MAEIGGNLIGHVRPLDAATLPPLAKHSVDPPGKAAGAASNDRRQRVACIVDIEAGDPGRLSRPQIALPAADPHKAEIVELDIAVIAFADMPERATALILAKEGLAQAVKSPPGARQFGNFFCEV